MNANRIGYNGRIANELLVIIRSATRGSDVLKRYTAGTLS